MSKQLLMLALFGLMAPAAGWCRADDPAEAEKAVRAVRDAFYAAAVRQDADAMGRLLTDDYVFIAADGSPGKKDERLKGLMRKDVRLQSVGFPDSSVRVYGDVAVEVNQANRMADVGGTGYRVITRNTIIYRKTGDGWFICGEHISPMPNPK